MSCLASANLIGEDRSYRVSCSRRVPNARSGHTSPQCPALSGLMNMRCSSKWSVLSGAACFPSARIPTRWESEEATRLKKMT